MKNTYDMFAKHLSEYLKHCNRPIRTGSGQDVDVHMITPGNFPRSESSKLNRDLGISGINKLGNKNGFKKLNWHILFKNIN